MTKDDFLVALDSRVQREAGDVLTRLNCEDALGMVSEGKRLRALLVYSLVADVNEVTVVTAAAIELFHAATLVHDDIIDNAMTRRNHPTISQAHSLGTAIMVGDALFARAADLVRQSLSDELQAEFYELYVKIAEAQNDELLWRGRLRDEMIYHQICHGKTGLLYRFCVRAAGAGELYERVVENIAYAFQIVDDIDDIVMWRGSAQAHASKIAEFDIDLGNVTLPAILALERFGIKTEEFTIDQIGILSDDDWQHGIDESRARAVGLVSESKKLLGELPSNSQSKQFRVWAAPMIQQLETISATIDTLRI